MKHKLCNSHTDRLWAAICSHSLHINSQLHFSCHRRASIEKWREYFHSTCHRKQSRQEAEIPTLVQVDSHPQKGELIINTIKNLTSSLATVLCFITSATKQSQWSLKLALPINKVWVESIAHSSPAAVAATVWQKPYRTATKPAILQHAALSYLDVFHISISYLTKKGPLLNNSVCSSATRCCHVFFNKDTTKNFLQRH